MRLTDLPRVGSFRIALLFLALFGAASAGIFGFLYLQTQRFQIAHIDDWLIRESQMPGGLSSAEVQGRFDYRAAHNPSWPNRLFSLYTPGGEWLAGDRLPLPAAVPEPGQPFDFLVPEPAKPLRFRGVVHRFPEGQVALVAQNLHESREFDEAFIQTMVWGGLLTALLGLVGAAAVGMGTVRQFDAAALAIQEIVRGDLSRRLPTGGTSGDLDRLVGVVNGMLDEIERLMREVKGVCDSIAHDLRTPLTRILASLERVQRRAAEPAEYALAVEGAIGELNGVLATFTSLLRIAEIEDGARRAGFRDVDLLPVARDVLDLYEPAAEDKAITLSLEADPARPCIMRGDAGLLFTALSNLVDNAIKFTPAGGTVVLGLVAGGDGLVVSVNDTGCGIAEGEREAVFRRFHRSEQSRQSPGNGLGLALVAAIARLHDLRIELEPRSPGTRIRLVWGPVQKQEFLRVPVPQERQHGA